MSNELAERNHLSTELQEKALLGGDLSKLTPQERLSYYSNLCASLDLNPLSRPFEYLQLNGKLQLYARKDCTEQLRTKQHVSIDPKNFTKEVIEGVFVVTVWASMPDGRTDVATGAVPIEGLKGIDRANAMMKAETKAKRRVTLSICGLGMLDETEIETIKGARVTAEAATVGLIPQIPQVRQPSGDHDYGKHEPVRDNPFDDPYPKPTRQEDGAGDARSGESEVPQKAAASQQASDAPAIKPQSAAEYAKQMADKMSNEPVFTFGKHKGKVPSDRAVPDDYLAWIEPMLANQINDPSKARYKDTNQALLDAVRATAIDRGLLDFTTQ